MNLEYKWCVKVNKFDVSDPYQRIAACPSGFFNTGEEIKKFIEEKVEHYKQYPDFYVVFEVLRKENTIPIIVNKIDKKNESVVE